MSLVLIVAAMESHCNHTVAFCRVMASRRTVPSRLATMRAPLFAAHATVARDVGVLGAAG